ncbi:MAG TPA: UvrD-helicase domain-containing protein [Vicinamibacterales bacterium]|nr:UvrD-helicase domain-containing protein [Vicinamibacterales bacterium]
MAQPTLFDLSPADDEPRVPDQAARDFAIDPLNHVVLEASAGTGKTRVLVDRYVRLIESKVDPRHILAITFTRKAAAEMRERVLQELRRRAEMRLVAPDFWRALRERIADIQISTIDAFCYGLLREFPLEADVDPAFEIADETEMGRFAGEAVDRTLRAARARLADDEAVRLLFARVKQPVLRSSVAGLLDRRHIALPAVRTFVKRQSQVSTSAEAAGGFVRRLIRLFDGWPERSALVDDGPIRAPEFGWLQDDLRNLSSLVSAEPARVQQLRRRIERYFLTQKGTPRQRLTKPFTADQFESAEARQRHEHALKAISPLVLAELDRLDADVNVLLARGLLTVLEMASRFYSALLQEHALIDFAGMLERSVALLSRQEEFARSRLKLQSRYHHILVDEFQDTSRLQWQLIDQLIAAWGEGEGVADAPMSIFVVGDRKQSIYRFRHAEVTLLDEAAERIAFLRPGKRVRQAITSSFRAVPELQAFVNAVCQSLETADETIDGRFRFAEADRFAIGPVGPGALRDGTPVLGVVAGPTMIACAAGVANEVTRLIESGHQVRDKSGSRRAIRADDIAILFRARAGHQYFEEALESRGVRTYVYKGLGFFDAPEVQDLQALLRYLAAPESELRAAELLRSRFFRLSDDALARMAPTFAAHLRGAAPAIDLEALDPLDRQVLASARAAVSTWIPLADRVPPSELLDRVLMDSAYAAELRGRRLDQARENVKKVRALVRRVENRGYTTVARLAEYFETLRAGDESNAIVEASGAVNLMTIHAAKGLEFPVVFVVNLQAPGRGRAGGFSVIERGPDGEPAVAFHATGATELEDRRDDEELKRLLYVALTRARDRLYLAAEVDGRQRIGRGPRSLGGLLPPGLSDLFGRAAGGAMETIDWVTPAQTFTFRVCATMPAAATAVTHDRVPADAVNVVTCRAAGDEIRRVTDLSDRLAAAEPGSTTAADASQRLVGTLVHRLFQRDMGDAIATEAIAALAGELLRDEELVDVIDVDGLCRRAASTYERLRNRADLREVLSSGQCFYEVGFSWRPDPGSPRIVRGIVDCVVLHTAGGATIVEIKTGTPRPDHQSQAEAYAAAVGCVLKIPNISVKIVYP